MEKAVKEPKKIGTKKVKKNTTTNNKKNVKKGKSKKTDGVTSSSCSARIEKLSQPKPKPMKPINEEQSDRELTKKLNINISSKAKVGSQKDARELKQDKLQFR